MGWCEEGEIALSEVNEVEVPAKLPEDVKQLIRLHFGLDCAVDPENPNFQLPPSVDETWAKRRKLEAKLMLSGLAAQGDEEALSYARERDWPVALAALAAE